MVSARHDDVAEGAVSRTVATLTLWCIALGTLVVGDYVGFGENVVGASDQTVGVAAILFGLAAVVIALPDAAARIALGVALTVQTLAITVAGFAPGFRFVWEAGAPELTLVLVGLAAVSLWMLSILVGAGQNEYARSSSSSWATEPGIRVRRTQFTAEMRLVLWAVLGVVAALMGHDLGARQGDQLLGLMVGVGIVALAHQVVWWTRRRRSAGRD